MIRFQDFVPKMTAAPGFLKSAEFEPFESALAASSSVSGTAPMRQRNA
jgi:hypothetical protein